VKRRLAQVLFLFWEKIAEEVLMKLWTSMPDRVDAVWEARGGHTKY